MDSRGSSLSSAPWLRAPDAALAREVADGVVHLHGSEEVPCEPDELMVVCLVRDGGRYAGPFMDHYRSLGVKHIAFLDNGSADDTVELLKRYDGVTILRSTLPYKDYKYAMKQYLMYRFGFGRWCLYVDIDELFDYPRSEVVGLSEMLGYLSGRGYTTVVAHMLDMFPEGAVGESAPGGFDLKEAHRFYDISDIRKRDYGGQPKIVGNTVASEDIELFDGGIRKTVFGAKANLTKHPLVFMDGEVRPMDGSSHRTNNARVADISCVLYHYKFLDDFRDVVEQAVREGSYYRGSSEYKLYKEILEAAPELHLRRDTARELASVDDLVGGGFLAVSGDYAGIADALEEEALERMAAEEPSALLERYRRLRSEMNLAREQIRERNEAIRLRERQLKNVAPRREGVAREQRLAEQKQALERRVREMESSGVWRAMRSIGGLGKRIFGGTRRRSRDS